MLSTFYADLHIHIGRDMNNKPVKITGAKSLTLTNILTESSRNKGIHMVGVIDSHVPAVQQEIEQLISDKKAIELPDGGVQFENVTLMLGSEIEVYDENCQGPIHVLCFFPYLHHMKDFSEWLAAKMKNINLSSQRYYGWAKDLQYKVKELEGLFIPAHVFTPFKSVYGKGVEISLSEILDPDLIDGIELGLSSDSAMADQISELHDYTFLSNSDAHSLAKIAREYQEIQMDHPSFKELDWALRQIEGRQIVQNYGMNPHLGKYYTTVCRECLNPIEKTDSKCNKCGSTKIVKGVADRIIEISDVSTNPDSRPPYLYQVPLEYLPALGPKTFQKLLTQFGTEMDVLHRASLSELKVVVPEKLAKAIVQMRDGKLSITAGGGGKYGKVDLI